MYVDSMETKVAKKDKKIVKPFKFKINVMVRISCNKINEFINEITNTNGQKKYSQLNVDILNKAFQYIA